MTDPLPRDGDGLIEQARSSIYHGDRVLASADTSAYPKEQGPWGSVARAHYARASTLIQLAHYLGSAEEAEDRKVAVEAFVASMDVPSPGLQIAEVREQVERQRQDDYLAGRELEARMNREDGR